MNATLARRLGLTCVARGLSFVGLALVVSCESDADTTGDTRASAPTVELTLEERAAQAEDFVRGNAPVFTTLEAAIAWLEVEVNVVGWNGLVAGSEHFPVQLPSGSTISNWKVDCCFATVLRPFGKPAYATLAPLLDHPIEYVRLGVYSVLNAYMYGNRIAYNFRAQPDIRQGAIRALVKQVVEDGLHPRPDLEAAGSSAPDASAGR